MPKTGNHTEVERIKTRIGEMVKAHFVSGRPTYYLSRLGSDLGQDRVILEELTGSKLAEFLRGEFDYSIEAEGVHKNVYFIRGDGVTDDVLAEFHKIPRYSSSFWAAFSKPLEEGEQRFINIKTLRFGSDEAELDGDKDSVREIERGEILASGAPVRAVDIASNIEAWLERQKLSMEPFLAKRRGEQKRQGNLLDAVLNSLDGDQLKRSVLPCDVIKKLIDTPI